MTAMTALRASINAGSSAPSQQVAVVVNVAIFVAVLAYVLHRQLTTKAVSSRTFILVAILFAYGLSSGLPTGSLPITLLFASVAVSIGFGIWRGTSMRLWLASDGVVYRRATALTITLWAVTVSTKLVLDGWETATTHTFSAGSVWLAMAVTLAVQQLVMLRRAKSLALADGRQRGQPTSMCGISHRAAASRDS